MIENNLSLPKKNIAIFASGSGSNAEAIARYFTNSNEFSVSIILCNNPNAYVLQRAKKFDINTFVFNREQLYDDETVMLKLIDVSIDLIVLAGFMWLIPDNILKSFKEISYENNNYYVYCFSWFLLGHFDLLFA